LLFASLECRKLVADFHGGDLTSDGGLPLLREVERKIGLIDALDAAISDPRFQPLVVHEQRTLLAQRVFALAAGYEDLNDHQTLRNDTLLQALTERRLKCGQREGEPLSSPPTLCQLENRVTRADLARMAGVLVEQFIASHATPPAELILDFDATDDAVHGNQEGRFFHGYYDHYCFMPLYVTCGQQLLVAYLRPANIDGAHHSWAILKLLVERFRQAWPDVKIIFRADSGFCRWRTMRWCDRHGVGYIIGLAKNSRLQGLARRVMTTARWRYRRSGQKQRLFEDFQYAAGTWDRPRRVIAKAEHTHQGENPRFLVTSLTGDAQELYDHLYCQRGDAENRIKEQQLGLFADRTSCHAFLANQFRVSLSAAAYVLMETLRRVGLAGTELAAAQVGTIRLKLLKIGGRVVRSVRRLVIHLASGYPLQNLIQRVLANLRDWRCRPATIT
jgi:hypothetical protein